MNNKRKIKKKKKNVFVERVNTQTNQ
jgi:hypothetical protein